MGAKERSTEAISRDDARFCAPAPPLLVILPGDPPEPCPELLTQAEAIRYLRLDVDGPERPDLTLRRYRELGMLRAVRVGRRIRYRRVDLDEFLAKKSREAPDSA